MAVRDNATEVASSILADSCTQDNGLSIFIFKELQHVVQWERTANICVENEEALRFAFENSIAKVVESSGSSQSLVFSKVYDLDLWELFRSILDKVVEDRFVVVTDHADFLDVGNLCDSGEAMPDNGMSSNFEEGLLSYS